MKKRLIAYFISSLICTCAVAQVGSFGESNIGVWGDTLGVWDDLTIEQNTINNQGTVFVGVPSSLDRVYVSGPELNGVFEFVSDGAINLESDNPISAGTIVMNMSGNGTVDLNAELGISRSLDLRRGLIYTNEHELLLLSDNETSLIGGSDTSYIATNNDAGAFKRAIASEGNKLLPVGDGILYRPLVATNGFNLPSQIGASFHSDLWNAAEPDIEYLSDGGWHVEFPEVSSEEPGVEFLASLHGKQDLDQSGGYVALYIDDDKLNTSIWSKRGTSFIVPGNWFTMPRLSESSYMGVISGGIVDVSAANLIVRGVTDPYLVFKNLEQVDNPRLELLNRWSNTVHKDNNYSNDLDMTKFKDGTYFWILKYEINGTTFVETYFVELSTPE
jgi:hypothetical protein